MNKPLNGESEPLKEGNVVGFALGDLVGVGDGLILPVGLTVGSFEGNPEGSTESEEGNGDGLVEIDEGDWDFVGSKDGLAV